MKNATGYGPRQRRHLHAAVGRQPEMYDDKIIQYVLYIVY